MLLVYCDTGAFDVRLTPLERDGLIQLHQFKYENRNRRIRRGAIPSELRYDETPKYTYADIKSDTLLSTVTYDDLRQQGSRFAEIMKIVGGKRIDAQHVDSAVLTGCTVFLTSDKTDIWSNRLALGKVTGLSIFHLPTEWEIFEAMVMGQARAV